MVSRSFLLLSISSFIVIFAIGCAGVKKAERAGVMDSPEHHYFTGTKFLERGDLDKAMDEFERARVLDSDFPPAYTGMGLVHSERKNFDDAFKNIERSKDIAKSPQHKIIARTGMIRVYTTQRRGSWLKDARKEFKKAKKTDPDAPSPYYYMGIAYKHAYKFDKSGEMFEKVLDLNKDYIQEANEEWALVQKIQRAAPGTSVGNRIALVDKIDRANVAALFIEELRLEDLIAKRSLKQYDTGFKTPFEREIEKKRGEDRVPEDIMDHPLKADMEAVISLSIRGLEVFPDGGFAPDQLISKANYALMLEDILMKVTGEGDLAKKFIGSASPFPDVRSDHYAFNAIMVCSTRDILKAKLNGEFGLRDTVSGADALLAIRRLKEELKIF